MPSLACLLLSSWVGLRQALVHCALIQNANEYYFHWSYSCNIMANHLVHFSTGFPIVKHRRVCCRSNSSIVIRRFYYRKSNFIDLGRLKWAALARLLCYPITRNRIQWTFIGVSILSVMFLSCTITWMSDERLGKKKITCFILRFAHCCFLAGPVDSTCIIKGTSGSPNWWSFLSRTTAL